MSPLKYLELFFMLVLLNLTPISADFGLFNFRPQFPPFQFGGNIANLPSRLGILEAGVASIRNQIASLFNLEENLLNQLVASQSVITGLQNQLAAIKVLKCPTTAPVGSVVLGSTCYSVNLTPATFTAAETACEAAGGTLATPIPAFSGPLLTALKVAFPTIGTTQLWIGASLAANAALQPATYVTGAGVLNPVFSPAAVANAAAAQGALLTNPNGSPWTLDVVTSPHAFVCQYNTLS